MAANTVNLSIRLDAEVKQNAEALFDDFGMNMTTAITLFLKQAIRNQAIPFSITMNALPNKRTLAAIQEAIALENDDNAETFHSIKELRKDLLS